MVISCFFPTPYSQTITSKGMLVAERHIWIRHECLTQ